MTGAQIPAIAAMWERCTLGTRVARFHAPVRDIPASYLQTVLADPAASVLAACGHAGDVVALASLIRGPGCGAAELGVLVEDSWQRCGIGRRLVLHLITTAPARGITTLTASVLAESAKVAELLRQVPGEFEIFDALVDGGPEIVVCRHEQNAAFMAQAIGRLTGTPGVVAVTSGPGTANLPTGLVTATTEQDPVIALCGAVPLQDRLKRTHQSMNAAGLLSAVTRYTAEVTDPRTAPEALANAFRIAMTEPRGAAALVLANDVMGAPADAMITTAAPASPLGPAPASGIDEAAAMIGSAARPVLLAGLRGADPDACQAVRALVQATGLPVAETFQAAGVVSRELESHYVGRVGLFKNQPGDVAVAHADVLVTIGYDPVEYDPRLWNADPSRTVIHIDSLPAQIDNHYQPARELRGDVAATVRALAGQLEGLALSAEFAAEVTAHRQALDSIDAEALHGEHGPAGLNPAWVVLKLREHLNDDATVAVDMGTNYIHMSRHFRVYQPRHLLLSNGQQTMGAGLPWAMAATLVRPGTQVVSVSGDGGFLMSAMELETARRLGCSFTHVILRDNALNMVEFQQLLEFGRSSGIKLGDYDIVSYAEASGARGYRVSTEDEFLAALQKGLSEEGPSVIDVPVDYSHSTDIGAKLHPGVFE